MRRWWLMVGAVLGLGTACALDDGTFDDQPVADDAGLLGPELGPDFVTSLRARPRGRAYLHDGGRPPAVAADAGAH